MEAWQLTLPPFLPEAPELPFPGLALGLPVPDPPFSQQMFPTPA